MPTRLRGVERARSHHHFMHCAYMAAMTSTVTKATRRPPPLVRRLQSFAGDAALLKLSSIDSVQRSPMNFDVRSWRTLAQHEKLPRLPSAPLHVTTEGGNAGMLSPHDEV